MVDLECVWECVWKLLRNKMLCRSMDVCTFCQPRKGLEEYSTAFGCPPSPYAGGVTLLLPQLPLDTGIQCLPFQRGLWIHSFSRTLLVLQHQDEKTVVRHPHSCSEQFSVCPVYKQSLLDYSTQSDKPSFKIYVLISCTSLENPNNYNPQSKIYFWKNAII